MYIEREGDIKSWYAIPIQTIQYKCETRAIKDRIMSVCPLTGTTTCIGWVRCGLRRGNRLLRIQDFQD